MHMLKSNETKTSELDLINDARLIGSPNKNNISIKRIHVSRELIKWI